MPRGASERARDFGVCGHDDGSSSSSRLRLFGLTGTAAPIVADPPGVPQAVHLLQGCLSVFATGVEMIAELGERDAALAVDELERRAHNLIPVGWIEVNTFGNLGYFAKML